jgi:hypothetical protein
MDRSLWIEGGEQDASVEQDAGRSIQAAYA